LVLLVATAVPDALNIVYLTTLRLQRRYFQASCFMWFLAFLQIVLTWWLVHSWGITGAGAAWLFAEGTGVLIQAVDHLWFHLILAPLTGPVGAGAVPAVGSERDALGEALR
jgi:Na+-driven multidrug efflux pump